METDAGVGEEEGGGEGIESTNAGCRRNIRSMTPSDDLSHRKEELEVSLDRYGKRSRIFGVLVVVGLIIEFTAIFLSFFHEAISRIVDACGLFIVTVGVGGEIRAEFNSHRAERRLRVVNVELSALADENVRERDEQIERLRLQNSELLIFLGDRRIIDPIEFQQAMHAFAGTVFMILASKDREARAFALSLRYNLEEAGWSLNQFGDTSLYEGVHITESGFDSSGPCSDAAENLADVLNGNRVAAVTFLQNQAPPWAMTICVGEKPQTIEMQQRIQEEREQQKRRRSSDDPKRSSGPLSPKV
jgi:hypothetical protein